MATCQMCGTECGADGVVTECRSMSGDPAIDAAKRVLNLPFSGTPWIIDARLVARALLAEKQAVALEESGR